MLPDFFLELVIDNNRKNRIDFLNDPAFSSLFYYEEPVDANRARNDTGGKFEISRVLQNKEKVFIASGFEDRKKKKILVLVDVKAHKVIKNFYLSDYDYILFELLSEGFKILARTNKGYCEIKNIIDLKRLQNEIDFLIEPDPEYIVPASKKEVQKELCDQNPQFSSDQIETIGVLDFLALSNGVMRLKKDGHNRFLPFPPAFIEKTAKFFKQYGDTGKKISLNIPPDIFAQRKTQILAVLQTIKEFGIHIEILTSIVFYPHDAGEDLQTKILQTQNIFLLLNTTAFGVTFCQNTKIEDIDLTSITPSPNILDLSFTCTRGKDWAALPDYDPSMDKKSHILLSKLLPKFPKVKKLYLYGHNFTDFNPDLIGDLKEIRRLCFNNCILEQNVLLKILQKCPNLEVLTIERCTNIEIMEINFGILPQLKKLEISLLNSKTGSKGYSLSDEGLMIYSLSDEHLMITINFIGILEKFPELTYVDIEYTICNNIALEDIVEMLIYGVYEMFPNTNKGILSGKEEEDIIPLLQKNDPDKMLGKRLLKIAERLPELKAILEENEDKVDKKKLKDFFKFHKDEIIECFFSDYPNLKKINGDYLSKFAHIIKEQLKPVSTGAKLDPEFFDSFLEIRNSDCATNITGREQSTHNNNTLSIPANYGTNFNIDLNASESTKPTHNVTDYFSRADEIPLLRIRTLRLSITNGDLLFESPKPNLHPIELDLPETEVSGRDEQKRTGKLILRANTKTLLPKYTPKDQILKITCTEVNSGKPAAYKIFYDKETSSYYAKTKTPCIFEYQIMRDPNYYAFMWPAKTGNSINAVPLIEDIISRITQVQSLEQINEHMVRAIRNEVKQFCGWIGNSEERLFIDLQKYFYNNYGGTLVDKPGLNNFQKIQEILRQKAGRCDHRCFAFMLLSAIMFDANKARMVTNQCHAFIEININGEWRGFDLRGTDADLNIKNNADKIQQKQQELRCIKYQITPPRNLPQATKQTLPTSKYFRVWEQEGVKVTEWENYLNELCHKPIDRAQPQQTNNVLFVCDNEEQIEQLRNALQLKAAVNNRAYFHIDNPDSADDNRSILCVEGGSHHSVAGPAAAFLDKTNPSLTAQNPGMLAINWQNFNRREIAEYQSIYDGEKPRIGNERINKNTKVIGFITTAKMKELGEDFHSRAACGQIIKVSDNCPQPIKLRPIQTGEKSLTVDLHYDVDFKEELVGHISVTENGEAFIAGILQQCIDQKITYLTIANAPQTREFKLFCEEINNRKKVIINGKERQLPENFVIDFENHKLDYDLTKYHAFVTEISAAELINNFQPLTLNIANYHLLFSNYKIANRKTYTTEGLLEKHAKNHPNQPLQLLITSNFTDAKWDKLLSAAQKYGCKLKLYSYPDVILPRGICCMPVVPREQGQDIANLPRQKTGIIKIKDGNNAVLDEAAKQLKQQLNDAENTIILPITEETAYQDLILYFNSELQADGTRVYKGEESAVLKWLKEGKNVILKGKISQTLYLEMESLFITNPHLGKLFLVTNSNFRIREAYEIKSAEIKANLNPKKTIVKFIENESAEDFEKRRRNAVLTVLEKNPCVFIEGDTATGKTSFVRKELSGFTIYEGTENCNVMAMLENAYKNPKQKFALFIDEANLENVDNQTLAFLAGIYGDPAQVLLQGKNYKWPNNCKVILTGNPQDFSQRSAPSYLGDYCEFISFPPLAKSYLLKKVLQPALIHTGLSENHRELIFAIYKNAKEILKEKATPRLLQKMGLNVAANNATNENDIIKSCLQTIEPLISLLAEDKKQEFYKLLEAKCTGIPLNTRCYREENEKLIQKHLAAFNAYEQTNHDAKDIFIATDCHKSMLSTIENALALRKLRIANPNLGSLGTRGLLFEGSSGIGKTTFLSHYLKYKRTIDKTSPEVHQITASNDAEEIKKIILNAAQKGEVVVIDEINLLPAGFIEGVLNGLLQGVFQGINVNPGFFVLATQNPSDHGGRQEQSVALRDRFDLIELNNYSREELLTILKKRGVNDNLAIEYVDDYFNGINEAAAENKFPFPTPRNLFGKIPEMLKKQQRPLPTPPLKLQGAAQTTTTSTTPSQVGMFASTPKTTQPPIPVKPAQEISPVVKRY